MYGIVAFEVSLTSIEASMTQRLDNPLRRSPSRKALPEHIQSRLTSHEASNRLLEAKWACYLRGHLGDAKSKSGASSFTQNLRPEQNRYPEPAV